MCCVLMSLWTVFTDLLPVSPRSVAAWKQADGSAAGWAWHHTGTDPGQRIQVAIQSQFKVSDLNKTSDGLSWAVDTRWSQNVSQLSSLHPALVRNQPAPPRPAPRLAAATYNLLCQYFGGNLGWRVESTEQTLHWTVQEQGWPALAVRECGEERQCCILNLHKPVTSIMWTNVLDKRIFSSYPHTSRWSLVADDCGQHSAVSTADFTPHMILFCGAQLPPQPHAAKWFIRNRLNFN